MKKKRARRIIRGAIWLVFGAGFVVGFAYAYGKYERESIRKNLREWADAPVAV